MAAFSLQPPSTPRLDQPRYAYGASIFSCLRLMEFIIVLFLKDSRFSWILYPADYARTATLIGRHWGTCTSVGGHGAELVTLLPGIAMYLVFGLTWTCFASRFSNVSSIPPCLSHVVQGRYLAGRELSSVCSRELAFYYVVCATTYYFCGAHDAYKYFKLKI